MDRNGMRPIHPGEVLNKEFMEPLGMTVSMRSYSDCSIREALFHQGSVTGRFGSSRSTTISGTSCNRIHG